MQCVCDNGLPTGEPGSEAIDVPVPTCSSCGSEEEEERVLREWRSLGEGRSLRRGGA